MTINEKVAKYILNSLIESEEYSKNVKLPSGKPTTGGRSKPKTPVSSNEAEDEDDELDEIDQDEEDDS